MQNYGMIVLRCMRVFFFFLLFFLLGHSHHSHLFALNPKLPTRLPGAGGWEREKHKQRNKAALARTPNQNWRLLQLKVIINNNNTVCTRVSFFFFPQRRAGGELRKGRRAEPVGPALLHFKSFFYSGMLARKRTRTNLQFQFPFNPKLQSSSAVFQIS